MVLRVFATNGSAPSGAILAFTKTGAEQLATAAQFRALRRLEACGTEQAGMPVLQHLVPLALIFEHDFAE